MGENNRPFQNDDVGKFTVKCLPLQILCKESKDGFNRGVGDAAPRIFLCPFHFPVI